MPSSWLPTTSSRSASPISADTSGSCGGASTSSGWSTPSSPRAAYVVTTGAPSRQARSVTACSAPEATHPPPAQITTRARASKHGRCGLDGAQVGSRTGWRTHRRANRGRRAEDVGGDAEVHRASRGRSRDGDGVGGHGDGLVGVGGAEDGLGQRGEQGALVRHLVQGAATDSGTPYAQGHLARDEQHRRVDGRGLAECGDGVGCTRAGGGQRDAQPSGGARQPVGGVGGGLLVPHREDPRSAAARRAPPERQVVHAGQTEGRTDSGRPEQIEDACGGGLVRRRRRVPHPHPGPRLTLGVAGPATAAAASPGAGTG